MSMMRMFVDESSLSLERQTIVVRNAVDNCVNGVERNLARLLALTIRLNAADAICVERVEKERRVNVAGLRRKRSAAAHKLEVDATERSTDTLFISSVSSTSNSKVLK